MALAPHLVAQLRLALRTFHAGSGPGSVPTGAGKALEAWVLMRMATAAEASGRWRVSLRLGDGSPLPTGQAFAFSWFQSGILPASASGPGHVLLERDSPSALKLGLHLGLQWKGRSGATHECDVSLLPHSIADPLRKSPSGGHPRGLPIAALECKDRNNVASPDEMRQTVARLYDLALVTKPYPGWGCRMFEAATTTRWGRYCFAYRDFFASGAFGVVRVGTFGLGARGLGHHYHVSRFPDVYTSAATVRAMEAHFMSVLDAVDFV